ncbi:homeobox-domain-containing protein [Obba rivulosa]|uniref:Homeobox-domain-containing protein n=1 Tax=Obba rivulosa TaxID=1052685 RepID=A0A8E2DT18_9APHY|nr:homeobox-domain-containing protein [Obba rivulosa]
MSGNPPEDHFHYGCFPRPTRRSPAVSGSTNQPRRGLFNIGQGPFSSKVQYSVCTSAQMLDNTAPDASFPATQYPQVDPSQARSDYNIQSYNQGGWPVNTGSSGSQPTPFAADPRYSANQQQPYPSYPARASPSMMVPDPHDARTLPPLNIPHSQGHIGAPQATMAQGAYFRPTTAGFSTTHAPYPDLQQTAGGYYPTPPDPRHLPPPIAPMPYDSHPTMSRRSSMSVDRNVPSRMSVHGPSPYARGPPVISPTPYSPEPPAPEQPIKKKRKRADPEQLKVLNETYARTAFPSTEERVELARKLGMSARSVQIWFQNKRQAMRQSSRQAASTAPPTTAEPYAATSQAMSPLSASGIYSPHAPHPTGSPSLAQGYPAPRASPDPSARLMGRTIPSPIPSHRARSPDEEKELRRYHSRPY